MSVIPTFRNLESLSGEGSSAVPAPQETLRDQKLQLGPLHLPSRFFLSPLAGYTNLPFRLVVRELGGLGLATTDLVNARALLQGSRKSMELIQTCPEDRPLAVQIYGSNPEEMGEAAQRLEDYGASAVDINMGCPVHKVVRGGGGSAMMCDPGKTIALVRAVVEAVRLPVTVKMRLGWDSSSWSAPFFAREFEQAGVAAVTIHGRTREQGFGGSVHLDGIRAVVDAVESIPVVGNGDIRTVADAARMFQATGCSAISIGRGALLNPGIFSQLQHWGRTGVPGPTLTYQQRLTLMDRHFHLLVAQRGERFACLTFRKVASWYCKVLRPGRDIQQRLVRIEGVKEFAGILELLRNTRSAREDKESEEDADFPIAVPGGPVERW